ncbi:MAG: 50S ribosomal protein L6 [Thermoplasmata archaeon]
MIKWSETVSVDIPKGIKVDVAGNTITFTNKDKKIEKKFADNYVKIDFRDGKAIISQSKNNSRERGIIGTWASEIKNIITGITEGFQYEMKIDYSHFPMRVSVKGKSVVIENFFGERSARSAEIIGDTTVTIKADRVTVAGISKKDVAETVANIERSTKIKGFDDRVFQDGIYLISKGEGQ